MFGGRIAGLQLSPNKVSHPTSDTQNKGFLLQTRGIFFNFT